MSTGTQPLVSIIIPCYNGADTLPMAIASLLCQTYQNWECIFIDDGSTDGSTELIKSLNDPRFRPYRFEENKGRGVARNLGNKEADGEYVAMLDADDWWYTNKLERQLSYLSENPKIQLVGTGMLVADKQGNGVGYRSCRDIEKKKLETFVDPPLAFATICMRKNIAKNYSYNPKFRLAQDIDFVQRVCFHEFFSNLPEPLYVYNEYSSYSWDKIRRAHGYRLEAISSFYLQYPIKARFSAFKGKVKLVVYSIAFALRLDRRLITRRSAKPSKEMLDRYFTEKEKIEQVANGIKAGQRQGAILNLPGKA